MTCFIAVSYIDYSHCLGKRGKFHHLFFGKKKATPHGMAFVT